MSSPSSSSSFLLHTSLRHDPLLLTVHQNPLYPHASHNYTHPTPLYLLPLHRDRLLRSATYFKFTPAISLLSGPDGLERLSNFITSELSKSPPGTSGPLRLRITLSPSGSLTLTSHPKPPVPLSSLFPSSLSLSPPDPSQIYTITLDTAKTTPSKYTHYKTTHRPMYDTARERAHIDANSEVLLVNENDGSIMEGSITTSYFFRNGRWVTPPVKAQYEDGADSGGNDGTSRRWALER